MMRGKQRQRQQPHNENHFLATLRPANARFQSTNAVGLRVLGHNCRTTLADTHAIQHTREDPPRGTKTMSCFHTKKWSRVKAFVQWLGALALDRVPRAMVWRDKPAVDICAEETGAFQCNAVQCNIECMQHRAKRCKFSGKRASVS